MYETSTIETQNISLIIINAWVHIDFHLPIQRSSHGCRWQSLTWHDRYVNSRFLRGWWCGGGKNWGFRVTKICRFEGLLGFTQSFLDGGTWFYNVWLHFYGIFQTNNEHFPRKVGEFEKFILDGHFETPAPCFFLGGEFVSTTAPSWIPRSTPGSIGFWRANRNCLFPGFSEGIRGIRSE